ncbi:hypothetical protein BpHYR1_033034 [Brachionus plicatilis]|uniref:PPM-type phosphatase domain-containing protein n=1 Tax=Brachionus plicatilis TaxID=10195 RepID=A0A3M7TAJ1_BRAPC|nr:hypothetical protein BpHYR1_033034 [Brachionus plicatilis]
MGLMHLHTNSLRGYDMSINDATNVASAAALASASSIKKVTNTLSNNILIKKLNQLRRKTYKCYHAKSYDQLPNDEICDLNQELISYNSGPDEGIANVKLVPQRKPSSYVTPAENQENPVAQDEKKMLHECWDSFHKMGITKFNSYHHKSYGIACSLYENNLTNNTTVGDPIADVYAIMTRKNSSVLILADGVNWGPRSRLAARCAVRASMNHLNKFLYSKKNLTTHDIFKIMCRSFDSAQDFILQRKAAVTTLCCCVVVKLKDPSQNSLWAVCTLSIGDSTAYVFNGHRGIFDLSLGARNLNNDRDMRNVGGALGGVYGNKPDVSNLTYSLMYIKENDIVFLMSDGVSDNLDPIVSQTARKQGNRNSMMDNVEKNLADLPEMSPYERYACGLAHMNEILLRNKTPNENLSAQETCAILIDHVVKLTAEKRDLLEKGLLEASQIEDSEKKAKFQADLRQKSLKLRGKLDHASIVAYEVSLL